jgi:hypothetical protein
MGPWCKNLDDLHASIKSMPPKYKSDFNTLSEASLAAVCNIAHLHVWETDSDIDNLLQLTLCIVKIRTTAGTANATGIPSKNAGPGMIIITEVKADRDNFARVCELVKYVTGVGGRHHLDNTVCAFGGIVVVQGVDNRHVPLPAKDRSMQYADNVRKEVDMAVKRINVAIDRVFKLDMFKSSFNRKIVWHHGPVIHFLLHWINNTTSTLRSSLTGITIQSALSFTSGNGIQPSPLGRLNTLPALAKLEEYTKTLGISAIFLDNTAQLVTFEYLATYMYFFGYYINTFLPCSLSLPHLHRAQDRLVTFAFRLWGACQSTYGSDVVSFVQKNLQPQTARAWASACIDSRSYTKEACQAAAEDREIHHAVQLADSPFETFLSSSSSTGMGLPAFSRLMVGPAQSTPSQYSIAAPLQISFTGSTAAQFRAAAPSSFRLLLPSPSLPTATHLPDATGKAEQQARLETITARIQGTMMAVLERVRQDKGMPVIKDSERNMWKEVVKAVGVALEGTKGRLPKGVGEKLVFVQQKLVQGTWGYALGAPNQKQATGEVGGWGADVGVLGAEQAQLQAMQAAQGMGHMGMGGQGMGVWGQ